MQRKQLEALRRIDAILKSDEDLEKNDGALYKHLRDLRTITSLSSALFDKFQDSIIAVLPELETCQKLLKIYQDKYYHLKGIKNDTPLQLAAKRKQVNEMMQSMSSVAKIINDSVYKAVDWHSIQNRNTKDWDEDDWSTYRNKFKNEASSDFNHICNALNDNIASRESEINQRKVHIQTLQKLMSDFETYPSFEIKEKICVLINSLDSKETGICQKDAIFSKKYLKPPATNINHRFYPPDISNKILLVQESNNKIIETSNNVFKVVPGIIKNLETMNAHQSKEIEAQKETMQRLSPEFVEKNINEPAPGNDEDRDNEHKSGISFR